MTTKEKSRKQKINDAFEQKSPRKLQKHLDPTYMKNAAGHLTEFLERAIKNHQPALLKIFLKNNANPNVGTPPLIKQAVEQKAKQCIELLFDYGANQYPAIEFGANSSSEYIKLFFDTVGDIDGIVPPDQKKEKTRFNSEKKIFSTLIKKNDNRFEKAANNLNDVNTLGTALYQAFMQYNRDAIEIAQDSGAKPAYALKWLVKGSQNDINHPTIHSFFETFTINHKQHGGALDEVFYQSMTKTNLPAFEFMDQFINFDSIRYNRPEQLIVELVKDLKVKQVEEYIIQGDYINVQEHGERALDYAYERKDNGFKKKYELLRKSGVSSGQVAAKQV